MSKAGVLIWRRIFESGDAKRLAKQVQDLSDLKITRDIPYIDDGEQGHLFDVYQLPDLPDDAPVMVNIHGGGLFASYKEVNVNFNYEWARMGYRVFSISYRRIPETTLWHQIDDCMASLRFLKDHHEEYHINLNRCYLTGDSAGALLSLFCLSLINSKKLQEEFGINGDALPFKKAGFISIMLDTQRHDLMGAIRNVVTDQNDKGKAYEKYLLDPASLVRNTVLPPLYLVSSAEDLIGKDSKKLKKVLEENHKEHDFLYFEKGKERKLVHVFSVCYPMYPESREVFEKMDHYFREEQ